MICLDMQVYFNFNEKENILLFLLLFSRLGKRIQKLCWREKKKNLKYILPNSFLSLFFSFPCSDWTEVEIPCSGEAFYSLSFHSVLLPCLRFKMRTSSPGSPTRLLRSQQDLQNDPSRQDLPRLWGSLGKQAPLGASRGGLGVWLWPLPATAGDWLPVYGRYKN